MRKVMMLASMLAMVLVAAAPAFAQASAVGGNVQIQDQYCPQVITQYANADQSNTGGGTGAGIAQDLGISQEAVNACLQAGNDINVGGGGTTTVVDGGTTGGGTAVAGESDPGAVSGGTASASSGSTADAAASAGASASAPSGTASAAAPSGSAAAASGGVLPDTGGASLIALGAGALLVGGGLLARKVIR